MNRLLIVFLALFLFACESKKEEKSEPKKEEIPEVIDGEWLKNVLADTGEKGKRIEKIKLLRQKMMLLKKKGKSNCREFDLVHIDENRPGSGKYLDVARQCDLEQDFYYRVMIRNGMEWRSKSLFLYEGENLIFAYMHGGAMSAPLEQKIYFDDNGDPISIIENSNPLGNDIRTRIIENINTQRGEDIIDDMYENLDQFHEMKNRFSVLSNQKSSQDS